MYEFHGWFCLSMSTDGEDESGLAKAAANARRLLEGFETHRATAELLTLNGERFIILNGVLNREEAPETRAIDQLFEYLPAHLPGSWGLLYDRNDEWLDSEFARTFRVRTLARGVVQVGQDAFLSPWQPVIED